MIKPVRLNLGVSKSKGVEASHFIPGTFNSNEFGIFLRKLKIKSGAKPVLFADNVAFHKSKQTVKLLAKLKLEIIFNMPYRPDRNPVEVCFAFLNRSLRKCASGSSLRASSMSLKS